MLGAGGGWVGQTLGLHTTRQPAIWARSLSRGAQGRPKCSLCLPPQQPSSRAPWHPQAVLDFSAALHEDDTTLSQTQATAPTRAASVSAQLLGPPDRWGVRLGSTRPAGLRVGQGGRGAPPAQGTGLGGS